MAGKPKFYVVWKGRQTGIFTNWEECEAQVRGFEGAQYKAFASRAAAEKALQGRYFDYLGKPESDGEWRFAPQPPLPGSYCVDAACSGSPGRLEYRGVETDTGRQIFRRGPFENGTNNIGEFLAIVHALAWLKQRGSPAPVYSDSETALAWVRRKKCNTDLPPDEKNTPLFALIARAEQWLAENDYPNPLLKWNTQAWGEIPADFNRK
ncbi:MAG: ribonuclease H family protein [Anaerolineales bacterium]